VAIITEARPLPRIEDITHHHTEGNGASAEPIGTLGGKSAVRITPLRFGTENIHAQTMANIPMSNRTAHALQPGSTSPDRAPLADGVS
jgi:hypothetical protein